MNEQKTTRPRADFGFGNGKDQRLAMVMNAFYDLFSCVNATESAPATLNKLRHIAEAAQFDFHSFDIAARKQLQPLPPQQADMLERNLRAIADGMFQRSFGEKQGIARFLADSKEQLIEECAPFLKDKSGNNFKAAFDRLSEVLAETTVAQAQAIS